ncbi:MAG: glycosyltransferase family A protein [Candidatus Competibacteraceae bacterium]
MAKIDIIIPCYNYGNFLATSVTSILIQSIKDLRILIIDDGSSDDTLTVAKTLAQVDSRISVVSHVENRGTIERYNEGIRWATADYLMIFSADDIMTPGALERAVAILDAHPEIVMVHGDWIDWDDSLPVPNLGEQCDYTWSRSEGLDLIHSFCEHAYNIVHAVTMIVRTPVQKMVGNYLPHLFHSGDCNIVLRFAMHGAVAHINAVQVYYRLHTTNMSSAYFTERWPDFQQRKAAFDAFFAEYADRLPNARQLQAQANRNMAEDAFWTAIGLICRGKGNSGRKLLRFAIDLQPSLRYWPPIARLARIPDLYKKVAAAFSIRLASLLGWSVTPWDQRFKYHATSSDEVTSQRGGHR